MSESSVSESVSERVRKGGRVSRRLIEGYSRVATKGGLRVVSERVSY